MSMRKLVNLFVDHERRQRRPRQSRDAGRSLGLESLEERTVPTVTALVQGAQLVVTGDAFDNSITISRDEAGTILVNDNDGLVLIVGGTPTVANTGTILVFSRAGNDTISLDETNGPLVRARLLGGEGDDVITGGSRGDQLFGEQGDDTLLGMGGQDILDGSDGDDFEDGGAGDDRLTGGEGNDFLTGGDGFDFLSGDQGEDVLIGGADNDVFRWSRGDGNDVIEGQAGFDSLQFDGSDDDERFDLSADGGRLRFSYDLENIALNVDGIERVSITAVGGADTFTINDLSGTDVTEVHIDLFALGSDGGGQIDNVIVNGSNSADAIRVVEDTFAGDASTTVLGLAAQVHIVGGEAAIDRLTINARNGDDTVDASGLTADAILLTEDGGNGNDRLIGGEGDDLLIGGNGVDALDGGAGDDLLHGGNGDDVLIGGPGQDLLDGGRGDDALLQD